MGVVKLYTHQNVLEAARERVRFVFQEFEQPIVSFSGGKDSTVVLQLALEAATELNRLPVSVLFIDQEAEWQATIDYMRIVMSDPRVRPFWLQMPFFISNAASPTEPWLHCWDPACPEKWMRPKEPDSLKFNVYKAHWWVDIPFAFMNYHFPKAKVGGMLGMRCQESPGRTMGLTISEKYKGVTWGSSCSESRRHWHFSPIYDWGYTDVWKYIHEKGVPYCRLYDQMYQYGLPIVQMRVSNVTHEQATRSLYFLQEVEPQTWNKLAERCGGVHAIGQMQASFYAPDTLPRAFASWTEYRDYLLENLTDEVGRKVFKKDFPWIEEQYREAKASVREALVQAQIVAILRNDWDKGSVGLDTFIMTNPSPKRKAKWQKRRDAAKAATESQAGKPMPVVQV